MSDVLEPLREKFRQLAHELAWLPERVAAITRELTEVEARLVAAGEVGKGDLAALGTLRLALHRVIADHIEPAIAGLQAAAGEASEDAG